MSEPRTTVSPESESEIPNWMQAVDREAFYNADPSASPEEDAASPAGPPAASSNGSTDGGASSSSGTASASRSGSPSPSSAPEAKGPSASSPPASSLSQKLHLTLGDTEQLPDLDPALQPVSAGSIRADLKRHLEQAVAVVSTRYTSVVSPSLVLEFALHRTLADLQNNDADSALVEWLDTKLSRK